MGILTALLMPEKRKCIEKKHGKEEIEYKMVRILQICQ